MTLTSETRAPVGRERAKERPIIFSAPMVRAILAGRKTQTRRALKLQPIPFAVDDKGTLCDVGLMHVGGDRLPRVTLGRVVTMQEVPFAVGDRLWVKEEARRSPDVWAYTADGALVPWPGRGDLSGRKRDICNSMFLPRSCSRLTLEVTEVRVERLQDISREDAIAEGCKAVRDHCYVFEGTGYDKSALCHGSPVTAFGCFWDEIHGADAFEANPWVAAITFRLLPANESQNEGAAV